MMHATLTTGPTVLVDRLPGDVKSSSAHGTTLAWLEAYDRDPLEGRYGRVELWASSAAAQTADLRPRFVSTMRSIQSGRLLDDHYCFTRRVDLQRYFELYDTVSARLRELPVPAGWVPSSGFHYIGGGEVGYGIAGGDGATLWRVPISSFPYVE